MTHRSLKQFINKNTQEHSEKIFDLIPNDIKSKIIFVVGENSSNTAEFLSSIMSTCDIGHTHYINTDNVELNKRFLQNRELIPQEILCENSEIIIKSTKKLLSNDDLFFALALSISKEEYSIIEMSEDYYYHINEYISPFALILTINNDEKANKIIDNAPCGTKEIISISQKENFDYISSTTNKNGARITLASGNKITVSDANLLGTSFYHYSYLYHISALDLNNVILAHLAIESAAVLFSAPRPYIYNGLEKARPLFDIELYSLSPAIAFWNGKNDFTLHHRLKFRIVTEQDEFVHPTENTVFCGSKQYIEQTKIKIKKR